MSDDVNNGINSGIALQYLNYIEPYVREIEGQKKEIASLKEQLNRQQEQHERAMILIGMELVKEQDNSDEMKELIIQATSYVEYAIENLTPLSQKLSEEWLEKTQARIEK